MMTDLPPLLASWLSRTEPGDWLLVALSPLFLMVVALEAWRWRGHGRYDWRDSLDSLNLGGIYTLV
ncbi:hypothetical protein, partial [Proteus terrae]